MIDPGAGPPESPAAPLFVRSVARDPRDPARVVVALSDGRSLAADASALEGVALDPGARVDDLLLARLEREAERGAARARALRYLETRERSRVEVERRLRRYGYADDLIGETLAWLEGLGYVDDRRFAEWYVGARARSGWGVRRLREELRRRGVPGSVIEEAAARSREDGEGGEALLAELAAQVDKRFGGDLAADRERTERRIAGYLARRGHDWEVVRAVIAIVGRARGADRPCDDGRGPETDR